MAGRRSIPGIMEGWRNNFVAYPEKTAYILMSNSLNFGHVGDKLLQVTIGDTGAPLKWLGFFVPGIQAVGNW